MYTQRSTHSFNWLRTHDRIATAFLLCKRHITYCQKFVPSRDVLLGEEDGLAGQNGKCARRVFVTLRLESVQERDTLGDIGRWEDNI